VSDYRYEKSLIVAAAPDLVASFFADGNAWFRLNPEWEVLAFRDDQLSVRYERSETEAAWRATRTDFGPTGGTVRFEGDAPRTLMLSWRPVAGGHTQLAYREEFPAPIETARLAELNLWLDATAGYLALAARGDRRGRAMRWVLDRFWLKLSPTARRVGLIVIAMEILALLLFVAILVVLRFTA